MEIASESIMSAVFSVCREAMCFGTGDESSINSTLENASAVFHRHNAPIENVNCV